MNLEYSLYDSLSKPLYNDLMDCLQKKNEIFPMTVQIKMHKASKHDEHKFGIDLGIVFRIQTMIGPMIEKAVLVQSKILEPKKDIWDETCKYTPLKLDQADKMLKHSKSSSYFLLYGPPEITKLGLTVGKNQKTMKHGLRFYNAADVINLEKTEKSHEPTPTVSQIYVNTRPFADMMIDFLQTIHGDRTKGVINVAQCNKETGLVKDTLEITLLNRNRNIEEEFFLE